MLNPPSASNPTPPPTVVNHLAMLDVHMHAPLPPMPPPAPSAYGADNYPQTLGGVIGYVVLIVVGMILMKLVFG